MRPFKIKKSLYILKGWTVQDFMTAFSNNIITTIPCCHIIPCLSKYVPSKVNVIFKSYILRIRERFDQKVLETKSVCFFLLEVNYPPSVSHSSGKSALYSKFQFSKHSLVN